MTEGSPLPASQPRASADRARVLRELTKDPGAPCLEALTDFVRIVHVRLFGVARDRDVAIEDRLGAVSQLGREALAAGEQDPKGVRPEVRQLLTALKGGETTRPNAVSPVMLEAIEKALENC